MTITTQRPVAASLTFLLVMLLGASFGAAQQGAPNGEWRSYGGDDGSTKYSSLDQIDAENGGQLTGAWQWESPDGVVAGDNRRLTPSAR